LAELLAYGQLYFKALLETTEAWPFVHDNAKACYNTDVAKCNMALNETCINNIIRTNKYKHHKTKSQPPAFDQGLNWG